MIKGQGASYHNINILIRMFLLDDGKWAESFGNKFRLEHTRSLGTVLSVV